MRRVCAGLLGPIFVLSHSSDIHVDVCLSVVFFIFIKYMLLLKQSIGRSNNASAKTKSPRKATQAVMQNANSRYE